MPIKPENRARYPKDWKAIRAAILERAGDTCEGSPKYPDCRAVNRQPHPVTGSKVVLTIAHLDHTPENNEPANLRAWCQRCHLTYDAAHHAANAAATRATNKQEERRLCFEWRCRGCELGLPWQAERGTPETFCPRCHKEDWRHGQHRQNLTDSEVREYWSLADKIYARPSTDRT